MPKGLAHAVELRISDGRRVRIPRPQCPRSREPALSRDRYVFHSLRHFAASSMLAEGVNPMAVAGHLGDTLETLQRVYAHWMREDLDVPADAFDRILDTSSAVLADQARTAAGR